MLIFDGHDICQYHDVICGKGDCPGCTEDESVKMSLSRIKSFLDVKGKKNE